MHYHIFQATLERVFDDSLYREIIIVEHLPNYDDAWRAAMEGLFTGSASLRKLEYLGMGPLADSGKYKR
jgi:hypothetical protein